MLEISGTSERYLEAPLSDEQRESSQDGLASAPVALTGLSANPRLVRKAGTDGLAHRVVAESYEGGVYVVLAPWTYAGPRNKSNATAKLAQYWGPGEFEEL